MFPLWINKKFLLLRIWIIDIQHHLFVSSFPQLTKLSQSANSTNTSYGRKRKNIEPSGGDVENNGRRKSNLGNCESFMNQPFIEELSDDDDIIEEESDPDVGHVCVKEILPLIFRFEEEETIPLKKEESVKDIKDFFVEMYMFSLESHIGLRNNQLFDGEWRTK
ncbi:hypothetical protein H5410_002721 [Solanum commersonii]|uniref:Uncharacterized protein n=1 Tax=Solanum commersonii TaxID=4109 RepID=A0A9J6B2Z2_SOLCO|nr:hypothetical protein H5410_002721 [Solanum commersonii]